VCARGIHVIPSTVPCVIQSEFLFDSALWGGFGCVELDQPGEKKGASRWTWGGNCRIRLLRSLAFERNMAPGLSNSAALEAQGVAKEGLDGRRVTACSYFHKAAADMTEVCRRHAGTRPRPRAGTGWETLSWIRRQGHFEGVASAVDGGLAGANPGNEAGIIGRAAARG